MQFELDLFDLELDALVLFLQAQFRLAQVPLGGEVRDLRKAGLEDVEGLGNQARTLIFIGRFGQLGAEGEGGAHGRVPRFLAWLAERIVNRGRSSPRRLPAAGINSVRRAAGSRSGRSGCSAVLRTLDAAHWAP
jgi:hypothetical protein